MICNFKDVDKQKEFEAAVQALFRTGVEVYDGYVDDPRNTDNAWMESRVAHFHCLHELGEAIPVHVRNWVRVRVVTKF